MDEKCRELVVYNKNVLNKYHVILCFLVQNTKCTKCLMEFDSFRQKIEGSLPLKSRLIFHQGSSPFFYFRTVFSFRNIESLNYLRN